MTEKLAQIHEKMMSKMKVLKFILVLYSQPLPGNNAIIIRVVDGLGLGYSDGI